MHYDYDYDNDKNNIQNWSFSQKKCHLFILPLFQIGRDNFYHRDSISSDKA